MTRTGSANPLADVRRLSKSIRSSKKSLLYSEFFDDDKKETSNNFPAQRSVSLTTLSPPPLEPRMAQLETLEAKMASIEVSLSNSNTPRRKKSGASTPQPPATVPRAATPKDAFTRDMEGLRATLRDKENNVLHTLKNQLAVKKLAFGGKTGSALNEIEKKAAHERLAKLRTELDNKRLAIKNIKLALETIDVTDNIDTRIQQAELEYQLGREELNLLTILEESRNLHASLEETIAQQPTIFSYIGKSAISLYGIELNYDPKSPKFGACQKEDGGLYIDWATDESSLSKGDRLLEVNGKLVVSKNKEDLRRLLCVSPNPAQLVVMRRLHSTDQIMSHLRQELNVVREQAGEAERLRDSFRSDNVRLSHRISYLEEQVAELLGRARGSSSDLQLFQKGHQVALVKSKEEVRNAKSVDTLIEKPKRKKDLARSTNSLDVENCLQRHYTRDVRSSLGFLEAEHQRREKQLDYSSESSSRPKSRPIPPKKPARLSLQKACSMQSVDSEKRTLKRTHKGDTPTKVHVHTTASDSWC